MTRRDPRLPNLNGEPVSDGSVEYGAGVGVDAGSSVRVVAVRSEDLPREVEVPIDAGIVGTEHEESLRVARVVPVLSRA